MSARATAARTFREDVHAWLRLGCLLAIGSTVLYGWLHRRVLEPDGFAAHTEYATRTPWIAVLAYDQLAQSPKDGGVPADALRAQIAALQDRGFVPITLDALHAFFYAQGSLPERCVLLTFDRGTRAVFDVAHPVLRDARWPAAVLLETGRQERRDTAFLYWDRLQRMLDSGIWSVGVQGTHGRDPIAIDAAGTLAPFLTALRWNAAQGRNESLEEFAARVRADLEASRRLVAAKLRGAQPRAFAPPGHGTRTRARGSPSYTHFEQLAAAEFELVFIDDPFGVNDAQADPRQLRRLRVDPSWSAEQLAARVDWAARDVAMSPAADPLGDAGPWIPLSGSTLSIPGVQAVRGERRADLWRAGSQWAEDWTLRAELLFSADQFWITQELADGSQQWRWGGTAHAAYLERKSADGSIEVLQRAPLSLESDRWHTVTFTRRGPGLWIEWDGAVAGEHPWYLPDAGRGPLGLVAWADSGAAELQVRAVQYGTAAVALERTPASPSGEQVQSWIQRAATIAGLVPDWVDIGADALRIEPLDRPLFSILARRYGWRICPRIHIHSERIPQDWAQSIATQLDAWTDPILCVDQDPSISPEQAERNLSALAQATGPAVRIRPLAPSPVGGE